MPQLNLCDKIIVEIDTALRTLMIPSHRASARLNPGEHLPEALMSAHERAHVASLMRVNHAGEVCAQALYQGQALTTPLINIKAQMMQAATEEVEHLAWCEQRLYELRAKPSILNPLWYSGALMIGVIAGLAGNSWSLGFVAETEQQVSKHLQQHLQQLPLQDVKTQAILTQMHIDETQHAIDAHAAGATKLPFLIKKLMALSSRLLTRISYYI